MKSKFKDFVQAVNEIDSGIQNIKSPRSNSNNNIGNNNNENSNNKKKGIFSKFRKSQNIEIPSNTIPTLVVDEDLHILHEKSTSYSPGHKVYMPMISPKSDRNKIRFKKALKSKDFSLSDNDPLNQSETSSRTEESTDEEMKHLKKRGVQRKNSTTIIGFFNSLNEQELSMVSQMKKGGDLSRKFQSLDELSFFFQPNNNHNNNNNNNNNNILDSQQDLSDHSDPSVDCSSSGGSIAERKITNNKYHKVIINLNDHIDNLSTMKKLFLNDQRFTMVSLCYYMATTETLQNKLTKNLIIFFESNHKSINLLRWAILNEINSTTKAGDIFREDSIASKLMGEYAKLVGSYYINSLLSPFIKKIEKIGKLSEERRVKMAEKILESIAKHPEYAPFQLRVLCYYIQEQVESKFEGVSIRALGAFLFLRFICPAICSPFKYGIVSKEISFEITKELVEIAKLIQTLVNYIDNNNLNNSSNDLINLSNSERNSFYNNNYLLIYDFLSGFGQKKMLEKLQEFPQILIESSDTSTSLLNLIRFVKERMDKVESITKDKAFWDKN